MSQFDKIAAKYVLLLQKHASDLEEKVKNIVKASIEELKSHPEMKGVFYASNVQLVNQGDYYHVSFILNVDNNPQTQDLLDANQTARAQLVKQEVARSVRSVVNADVHVDFGEYPTNNPGWFGKKYD